MWWLWWGRKAGPGPSCLISSFLVVEAGVGASRCVPHTPHVLAAWGAFQSMGQVYKDSRGRFQWVWPLLKGRSWLLPFGGS